MVGVIGKALQTDLLIYHPLHVKCFQYDNATSTEQYERKHVNRPFSKMAAESSNKSKLKTYTSTRKNTVTLVNLPSFSFSGEISAEKM